MTIRLARSCLSFTLLKFLKLLKVLNFLHFSSSLFGLFLTPVFIENPEGKNVTGSYKCCSVYKLEPQSLVKWSHASSSCDKHSHCKKVAGHTSYVFIPEILP